MIGDGWARSPSRVCGVCKREPALEEIGPRINGREVPLGPKCAGKLKAGDLVFVRYRSCSRARGPDTVNILLTGFDLRE